jgi:hypothetical protein
MNYSLLDKFRENGLADLPANETIIFHAIDCFSHLDDERVLFKIIELLCERKNHLEKELFQLRLSAPGIFRIRPKEVG